MALSDVGSCDVELMDFDCVVEHHTTSRVLAAYQWEPTVEHPRAQIWCAALAGYSDGARWWLHVQIFAYTVNLTGKIHSLIHIFNHADTDYPALTLAKLVGYAMCCLLCSAALIHGRAAHIRVTGRLKIGPSGPFALLVVAVILLFFEFLDYICRGDESGYHWYDPLELLWGVSAVITAPGIVCAFLTVWTTYEVGMEMLDELLTELNKPTAELDWSLGMPKFYGQISAHMDTLCRDISKTLLPLMLSFTIYIICKSFGMWTNNEAVLNGTAWEKVIHSSLTFFYFLLFIMLLRLLTRVAAMFCRVHVRLSYHLCSCTTEEEIVGIMRLSKYMQENPICWVIYVTSSSIIRIQGSSSLIASLFLFGNAAIKLTTAVKDE